MKRKVADELAQRKNLEVSSLWGNPNLDEEEGLRQQYMDAIESSFDTAIAVLYGYKDAENDVNEEDPFWQAMERGLQKRKLPEVE